MGRPRSSVRAGDVRRRRLLDSEAIYRVIAVHGDSATVEVVSAPGLLAGARFRFVVSDLEAMERVTRHCSGDDPDDPEGRPLARRATLATAMSVRARVAEPRS
jgi:hypothetical protein